MPVQDASAIRSAIGGGGTSTGGINPSMPVQDVATIRSAIGGEPLSRTSQQVKDGLSKRAKASDSIISTDVFNVNRIRGASVDCTGKSCQVSGSDYYISDINTNTGSYEAVMSRHGVAVGQGTDTNRFNNQLSSESLVYGGWTDHSFFFIEGDVFEYKIDGNTYKDSYAIAMSIGNLTNSTPRAGSATWKGVMVGGELQRKEVHQGDATLKAYFSSGGGNIDAEFTNIHDVNTGSPRNSIYFRDVPFTKDGFKSGSRTGNRIEGKFYGPGHAEAGGIFEHLNTIGAFGVKRQ